MLIKNILNKNYIVYPLKYGYSVIQDIAKYKNNRPKSACSIELSEAPYN